MKIWKLRFLLQFGNISFFIQKYTWYCAYIHFNPWSSELGLFIAHTPVPCNVSTLP